MIEIINNKWELGYLIVILILRVVFYTGADCGMITSHNRYYYDVVEILDWKKRFGRIKIKYYIQIKL